METFAIVYTLLGGLGIFFFGMKLFSDGLQAIAGDAIRKIMNSISTNRLKAVGAGLGITVLVQSSSITSVMVVGMVNAGLMTLKQGIGVIFGANLGTTSTGWLLALQKSHHGLLLVALGFVPGLFAKTSRWEQGGKVLLGVGLVFVGYQTMVNGVLPLRENQTFLESIAAFNGVNYGAWIASILMGCALTMLLQSSVAMLGITMVLAYTGIIGFETAVALVLGENIGKTITALLASFNANVSAKRAAWAHAIFNLAGVALALVVLPHYFSAIEWLIPGQASELASDGTRPYVGLHIAMAHTMFNLLTNVLFFPFLDSLANLMTKLTAQDENEKPVPYLLMLGNPQDLLPATSLVQAESEIRKMADIVARMYKATCEYWRDNSDDPSKLAKILDYERITDNIHKEVTVFLCYVMERPLSHHQSEQTQALIKIADELESCADYLERLATYRQRFQGGETLEGESRQEFFSFMDEVHQFFSLTIRGLQQSDQHDMDVISAKSEELQIWADSIRDKHLDRIAKGAYKPVTALTFSDMVVALRKIRTHAFRMSESVEDLNLQTE